MGQKVTTKVVDKLQQDIARHMLWILIMKLLDKAKPETELGYLYLPTSNLNTAKIEP